MAKTMEQPGDTIGHRVVGLETRDAGRGSGTRDAWKGVGASVLLHVAAAALVLFAISAPPPSRTHLVIDLTIGGPWGDPVFHAPDPARGARQAAISSRREPPAAAPAPPTPTAPVPAGMSESHPAPRKEASPVDADSAPPARKAETAAPRPSGSAGTTERGAATPGPGAVSSASTGPAPVVPGSPQGASPGASTARAGAGAGDPGETRGKSGDRDLERRYAYIRDAIQQEIAYPAMARKMGWEGRVVVSFSVLSDGSVRDVRIVQGSGHSALDRGAVEAVRKAAPFPRPPAEAEIITPVVYRLD